MATVTAAAPTIRASAFSRIYGFGSIYAKTIRDSESARMYATSSAIVDG